MYKQKKIWEEYHSVLLHALLQHICLQPVQGFSTRMDGYFYQYIYQYP